MGVGRIADTPCTGAASIFQDVRWAAAEGVSENVTAAVLLLHERSVNESIIVWDLGTVPDLAAAARLFDMGGASDAEVHEIANSG